MKFVLKQNVYDIVLKKYACFLSLYIYNMDDRNCVNIYKDEASKIRIISSSK